jgi:hypothetical protein
MRESSERYYRGSSGIESEPRGPGALRPNLPGGPAFASEGMKFLGMRVRLTTCASLRVIIPAARVNRRFRCLATGSVAPERGPGALCLSAAHALQIHRAEVRYPWRKRQSLAAAAGVPSS